MSLGVGLGVLGSDSGSVTLSSPLRRAFDGIGATSSDSGSVTLSSLGRVFEGTARCPGSSDSGSVMLSSSGRVLDGRGPMSSNLLNANSVYL